MLDWDRGNHLRGGEYPGYHGRIDIIILSHHF